MKIETCRYKEKCKKYLNEECPLNSNVTTCLKLYKISELMKGTLLTENQSQEITMRLDSDHKDEKAFDTLNWICQNIEEFVKKGLKRSNQIKGLPEQRTKNIYIYSDITGNGKTHWSIKILQSYIEAIWYKSDIKCRALFINVPRFFIALKENIEEKSEYIEYIKNNVYQADIVVWDDVATKGFTQYETENLLSIINSRIDSNKANIYTSNVAGDELERSMGDRLYSRVFKESEVIIFKGSDKRNIF